MAKSPRYNIPYTRVPAYTVYTTIIPRYKVAEYGAMLDCIYEMVDMQAASNGESIIHALNSVVVSMKREENWYILPSSQKTIVNMLKG